MSGGRVSLEGGLQIGVKVSGQVVDTVYALIIDKHTKA